jgi:hypothetical protein
MFELPFSRTSSYFLTRSARIYLPPPSSRCKEALYERRTEVLRYPASSIGPACPRQRMFCAGGVGGVRHSRSACDRTMDSRSGHATSCGCLDAAIALRDASLPISARARPSPFPTFTPETPFPARGAETPATIVTPAETPTGTPTPLPAPTIEPPPTPSLPLGQAFDQLDGDVLLYADRQGYLMLTDGSQTLWLTSDDTFCDARDHKR